MVGELVLKEDEVAAVFMTYRDGITGTCANQVFRFFIPDHGRAIDDYIFHTILQKKMDIALRYGNRAIILTSVDNWYWGYGWTTGYRAP
jgi:hypothetical protein